MEKFIPKRFTKVQINNIAINVAASHLPIKYRVSADDFNTSRANSQSEQVNLLPGLSLHLGKIEMNLDAPMYAHVVIPLLSAYENYKDIPEELFPYCYNNFNVVFSNVSLRINFLSIINGEVKSSSTAVTYPINNLRFEGGQLLLPVFFKKHTAIPRLKAKVNIPQISTSLTYPIVQYFWRFIGTYFWFDYSDLGQFHETLIRRRILSNSYADCFTLTIQNLQGEIFKDGDLSSVMFSIKSLKTNVQPHNDAKRIMPIFEGPILESGIEKISFFTKPELSRTPHKNVLLTNFITFAGQHSKNNKELCFLNLHINKFSLAVATRVMKILKRNLFALELKSFFAVPEKYQAKENEFSPEIDIVETLKTTKIKFLFAGGHVIIPTEQNAVVVVSKDQNLPEHLRPTLPILYRMHSTGTHNPKLVFINIPELKCSEFEINDFVMGRVKTIEYLFVRRYLSFKKSWDFYYSFPPRWDGICGAPASRVFCNPPPSISPPVNWSPPKLTIKH